MFSRSIHNLDLMRIADENGEISYGYYQEWYSRRWQRYTGCGPTVVSNIIHYLYKSRINSENNEKPTLKSECVKLMEDVWKFVTPTIQGINTTCLLCTGVSNYAQAKGLRIITNSIDVPTAKSNRPEFSEIIDFIDKALSKDIPVAFLNLDNGREKKLQSWHWVPIVSIEYDEGSNIAIADIIDKGSIKKINLAEWFCTTTLGGGFVSIDII